MAYKNEMKQVSVDAEVVDDIKLLADHLGFTITKLVGLMLKSKIDELKKTEKITIDVVKDEDGNAVLSIR